MASPRDEAAARTEVLLRDAEEALQQERLREFWKQWGGTVIGMALMLIVGTAGGVLWRHWRESGNEKATSALIKVMTEADAKTGAAMARDLGGNHAAIAYLDRAGSLILADQTKTPPVAELEKLYALAAREGDESIWGWLGALGSLRLKMDDPATDIEALLKKYEELADRRKGREISALAWTDAAILAGERGKDSRRALAYLDEAEKVVSHATSMSYTISDLKHLYGMRAGGKAAAPAAKEEGNP